MLARHEVIGSAVGGKSPRGFQSKSTGGEAGRPWHPAPEDALKRALKLKPQVIYFLTDGEIPPMTRDTAREFNRDHKTVIHTIAIGTEGGAEMLRAIAQDNGGKYQFVP